MKTQEIKWFIITDICKIILVMRNIQKILEEYAPGFVLFFD